MDILKKIKKTDAEIEAERKRLLGIANRPPVLPAAVGTGEQVAPGFMRDAQGRLVSQDQMRTGLESAAVSPDLTEQMMAAAPPFAQGATGGKGQPAIQLGGTGLSAPIPVTNQQFNSALARSAAAQGGVTNVTPFGTVVSPMKVDTNYSASGLGGPGVSQVDRAKAEMGQFAQSRAAAGSAMGSVMPAPRTYQEQVNRARQLEQDQINQGLLSANQRQQDAKLTAQMMEKLGPAQVTAQGKQNEELIKRGLDPQTGQPLPGANQPVIPVKNDDGSWTDQNTGKLITSKAVLDRLDAQETRKADIEVARALPFAKKSSRWNPLSADNVWGFNPKSGKFLEFGSQGALDKNKDYVPLSPEQQKAYEQGNKGLNSAAPVAPQAGPGFVQGLRPGKQVPVTGLQSATPPAATAAQGPQVQQNAVLVRTQLLGLNDPEQKKNMIRAKLQDGTLTKEQAKALALEHGLQ